ncbi:MAG: hypothetical protein ACREHD_10980 [Pirellulales bacterium]
MIDAKRLAERAGSDLKAKQKELASARAELASAEGRSPPEEKGKQPASDSRKVDGLENGFQDVDSIDDNPIARRPKAPTRGSD